MHTLISALFTALIAFVMALVLGPLLIPVLTRLKVGQSIRAEGPQTHLSKAGTPTMGGIIIITAVMAATFIVAGKNVEALTAAAVMMAFGGIGFWDDYIKVVLKRSLGLRAREKIGLQLLIGLIFGLLLVYYFQRGTQLIFPVTGDIFDLGILYVPFIILVLMATSNAVNLTDGLDGLAAGVTMIVSIALAIVSVITGHYGLLAFSIAAAGACGGFLVFNRFPAKVFMGDTGSMALGGAVAAVAALTKTELFLVIIGGVYVIEALSVIIQVISFQTTGKRIFLMSPLHHHFELKGWPEKQVVKLFYLGALVFVVIGLLSIRGIRF